MNDTISLQHMPVNAVKLQGILGSTLHNTIINRLNTVNYRNMVDIFRYRNETDNRWRCEFWGKVVRSAIWSLRSEQNQELEEKIHETVHDMLSTQTNDGCISSYPEERQLKAWDIWGRKYVMIALLRYYDTLNPDPQVKNALTRMLDHLIGQLNGEPLQNFGEHCGLAACSILGAVVGIYRITGEKRFLDFAKKIVDAGCCSKHNIFEEVLKGTPPCELSNGKAYEMMSCFQGLADYYVYEPQPQYKKAVLKFFDAVRTQEIFITGGGGMLDAVGEFWYQGKRNQTRSDAGANGETCVTVTYLHLCDAVMSLSDVSSAPLEMVHTTCNALLGAVRNDGRFWCHANPTPLAGAASKVPASDQMTQQRTTPFDGHDCCIAQGPEGLALAAMDAVMRTPGGVAIHYFEPMEIDLSSIPGVKGTLTIESNYPFNGKIYIKADLEQAADFELHLLVPAWQKNPLQIKVNDRIYTGNPGGYLAIKRKWSNGDFIQFELDFSMRREISPDGKFKAFLAGPLVLARDSRLGGDVNVPPPDDLQYTLCMEQENSWARFACRLSDGTKLCAYISAGSRFLPGNLLRVWHDIK